MINKKLFTKNKKIFFLKENFLLKKDLSLKKQVLHEEYSKFM